MPVSNMNDATLMNVRWLSEMRTNWEDVVIDSATAVVLAPENAPVQIVANSSTGALRLPLAAKNGTLWIVKNVSAAAETLVVTDDAGSPVTIATITADASAIFMKKGDAYTCILEGAAIL